MSTLGFVLALLAVLLAPLPSPGLLNLAIFLLGLLFIYTG